MFDQGYPLHDSVKSLLEEMLEFHSKDKSKERWIQRMADILAHDRDARRGERCLALVREAIYAFPQHGTDDDVNGADTVDWLMEWLTKAKAAIR